MLSSQLSFYMSGLSPQIGGISDESIVQPGRQVSEHPRGDEEHHQRPFPLGWTLGLASGISRSAWHVRATTSNSRDTTRRAGARPSTRLGWNIVRLAR